MNGDRQQLIDSFIRNPTTYTITIIEKGMLPKELRDKKTLDIKIKPPTLHVLTLAASKMGSIPEEIIDSNEVSALDALKYQKEIAEILSIFANDTEDYPEWYPDFIIKNIPSIDLLKIMQETAVKCSPGFFLSSIQVAAQANPLIMRKKADLTPISL